MAENIFTVYAIISDVDGRIYVGFTNNLERRLNEHNRGKTKSTKHYRPWKLLYSESFPNRSLARNREIFLKRGSGKEFLKALARNLENSSK